MRSTIASWRLLGRPCLPRVSGLWKIAGKDIIVLDRCRNINTMWECEKYHEDEEELKMASDKASAELVTISCALPKAEAKKVKEAAEADRRSVSNWLRGLILKALEKTG